MALVINHLQNLGAQIYLERVKLRMINKKALTSGDKQFGLLHAQQKGKLAVMEAEYAHFMDELESLKSKKVEEVTDRV